MAIISPANTEQVTDSKELNSKELSKEEIYDLITEDETAEERIELAPKEKEKESGDGKKEDKEEKDDDREEKDGDGEEELQEIAKELDAEALPDDELEIVTPVRRKEILSKYPNIFKDFPYLEKAYYREQKFTEVYPTIEDATTAKAKADTLDNFETQLMNGDLSEIIRAVKDENREAFHKLADNYLLAISKVDEVAYHHVVANIIKGTIINMVKEAQTMGEQEGAILRNTAQILNQYVFGTSQFQAPQRLGKEEPSKSDKEKEFEEREKSFVKQRFDDAQEKLQTRVDNTLKNTISSYIDPKDSMTPYVKKNAEREAIENIYNLLGKDGRFNALKDKLWQNAHKKNFDSDSMDKIKSAILSRAKSLLPSVIKQARNEALKGMGKRVRENQSESESEESEVEVRPTVRSTERSETRKPTSSSSRGQASKIPAGMSNKDYIMSDL